MYVDIQISTYAAFLEEEKSIHQVISALVVPFHRK
jgi:hypothetical protein